VHSANGNIERFAQKPTAATAIVYVLTVYDTNRKRPSPAAGAEKGHKTRASEVCTFSMRASGALFLFIQFVVLAADLGFTYPAKLAAEG